ncbi:MAG: exodeoxyribonuclease VII large subunit [Bacteroidia bacterium]|nr:exodeoxyribonuclease VII large subunit [Bacteroidia bacterium]
MASLIQNKPIYSLQEIASEIKTVLEEQFERSFWVKAEINKLNHYTYSGHCYPELVDKNNGKIVAQMRSVLWKTDFDRVNANFIKTIKEPLKDGIKVMMLCTITFDAQYGLSLRIHDIDPSYSLGDLELEKKLALEKLNAENLIDLNKSIPIPLLPQRIAIISVETSKGFIDFTQVIENNDWGYRFFYHLFPAILQGDSAIKDIQYQLKRILKVRQHFDVVAIIRGGGGDVGLSCYNDFNLAKSIAEFPLPVLSGIGHATNETVVEMITCVNAITPTKLAEFLIQKFHDFSEPVLSGQQLILNKSRALITQTKSQLNNSSRYLKSLVNGAVKDNRHLLSNAAFGLSASTKEQIRQTNTNLNQDTLAIISSTKSKLKDQKQSVHLISASIKKSAHLIVQNFKKSLQLQSETRINEVFFNSITKQKTELKQKEQLISMADPINVLKRGFSITRLNGVSVNSIDQLNLGDSIETELADGSSKSTITITNIKNNNE